MPILINLVFLILFLVVLFKLIGWIEKKFKKEAIKEQLDSLDATEEATRPIEAKDLEAERKAIKERMAKLDSMAVDEQKPTKGRKKNVRNKTKSK